MYAEKEKVYIAFVSKHNSKWEKQIILLIIPNRKGWHYLVVKKLSALLRGITFIIYADLECLFKKIDRCNNNLEDLSTAKVGENISSGFSMSTISPFESIENKCGV